ncbi:MAG: MBL fold metallo-hydrolase [Candidatus Acidiferrales bacterium]|jgi:glyoxylase-like metal-dependent hydrolase (beta-lactamase superfamily II)
MRILRWVPLLAAIFGVAAHAQAPAQVSAASQSFEIVKVTDGVYAGIGLNGVFGNGAFIVNRDNVLVVDTQERPSWARDFIADIRQVTPKPVHYVVNTHYHRDHSQGNQAYVEAFGPDVEIIAQETVPEDMRTKDADLLQQSLTTDLPTAIAQLEKTLADGKDAQGASLTDDARARIQHQLDLQKGYLAEIPQIHLTLPTLTYDRTLILHTPDRDICLYHFGLGHTRGDTVVYLPKEKIVITGDLLTFNFPNMKDSYPVELVSTLESIDKLDWDHAIPGHGEVEDSHQQIQLLLSYMRDLVAATRAAVAKGETLDQAVQTIDLSRHSSIPGFAAGNPLAIARAYNEITGKTPMPPMP